ELAMGIAVHAGPVVAGNIGSPDRVKYGVLGSAVNLASRMQALAIGGEVLISDAALLRMRPVTRVGPTRYVRVKGIAEPVAVCELLGFADAATREPVRRASHAAGA
ncbi:MAG TPA: adenylate/guanylate cyclase domain-containing protein, partial [Candidatus Binatia bacterium]|nr:adenylate/guanylate cyclase domain-containing protein [Candidatus Binatia bacterium]